MSPSDIRTHEVTFCSRAAGWANEIFGQHPEWPFLRAEIEESTAINRKRSDFRVYGKLDRLILAGEVKLPGTVEGRNPYNSDLLADSAQKADNAGAEYFFTWNVNCLVLFDRKKWHLPLLERCVQEYALGVTLDRSCDVERPEVESHIREFLCSMFRDLAVIVEGQRPQWGMRLDEWFIRAFEHHVQWPVRLTADHMWAKADQDKTFDSRLQEWMGREQGWLFARNSSVEWRAIVDRGARTLCYVFANRLIFYESCRAKFGESLVPLDVPPSIRPDELQDHFQRLFQNAVEATGDYETLFYPYEKDWASPLIFAHPEAVEAWRSVIRNLEPFNFKLIPMDALGGIFRRLVDPEERHKFGQHFTNEDIVDVIGAFCIRDAEANIMDPASGSGSFVVRGYHRKAWLKQNRRFKHASVSHQDWLQQIYAVDISLFAAHLCTLNLAARDIRDEENYPRVRRANFFEIAEDVSGSKPFCFLPTGLRDDRRLGPIQLPPLDAVVGNPPYVRQELIPRRGAGVRRLQAKEDLAELCARLWPGLSLSGRSDLHCYFWPAAAKFLKDGGWFGFVVSSSWLDVEYGFALQEWVLRNFRIHAVLESNAEPWFEDARVKTCAVILQRCSVAAERAAQIVRFVRLDAPLRIILGERPDENSRQTAAERFRGDILACRKNTVKPGLWRVVLRKQDALWQDGVRAGRLFESQRRRGLAGIAGPSADDGNGDAEGGDGGYDENGNGILHEPAGSVYGETYGGGKWGKYLRAPELYFRIMERFGNRFVPLGEIAGIRRGVTSGCDAFFMPRDVSAKFLAGYDRGRWKDVPMMHHCARGEVESGEVKLIEAGDGTVHPVETRYLAPEVHSLMNVSRPTIRAAELDRLILLVSDPISALKGTHVLKYLRYGEKTTFASKKSKAVPVAVRTSCASRPLWYDLTGTRPGHLVWPKSQQYRHVVALNGNQLLVNCNLYDITAEEPLAGVPMVLAAILNSTLIALFKTFYGRYAGTEGNLKTEVVDVNLLEVPDPRHVSKTVAKKLMDAFARLCERETMPLVEEEFMDCRSADRARRLAERPVDLPSELRMDDRRALDLAVFELIGVSEPKERGCLCDELYRETSAHFRRIRVVEIQKQAERTGSTERAFRDDELAADLWDSLPDADRQPLVKWLSDRIEEGQEIMIPDGTPTLPAADDMLDPSTVFFSQRIGAKRETESVFLPSRHHAEIVFALAKLGIRGNVRIPQAADAARGLNGRLIERLEHILVEAGRLAGSRTGDERKASDLAALLRHWMVHGK